MSTTYRLHVTNTSNAFETFAVYQNDPDLVRELEQRHLGARGLAIIGYRVDGSIASASVATSTPRSAARTCRRGTGTAWLSAKRAKIAV